MQKQLKDTVMELLRVYLKGKEKFKRDTEINELLQRRSVGCIQEEEWMERRRGWLEHDLEVISMLSRSDLGVIWVLRDGRLELSVQSQCDLGSISVRSRYDLGVSSARGLTS